jgi:uncharacterized membrane protein YsdA (DUF1294 family)
MKDKKPNFLFVLFVILFVIFAVYSYALLDPNLTLTSFTPFLNMQKKMRWFGWFNKPQSTIIFILLSVSLYMLYWLIVKKFSSHKSKINQKNLILFTILIGLILVFAYPSFSHDIYNYIFNAKMVLVYKANPHQQVAVDFVADPMLGFMHNIHTPAPYWYLWTIISLVPAAFTLHQIFPSMLIFKFFSLIQMLGCFWLLTKIWSLLGIKNTLKRSLLFLFNPLFLVEAIGVGHNDFSMMFLAFWSFYWLLKYKKDKKIWMVGLSFLLLLLSGGIKYATLVLIPLYLVYMFVPFDIGLWGAIALFLLPLTRIEQLHSWYLIWPLTWVFLTRSQKALSFFILLSFFALLRYAPYIYYGNWDSPVPTQRLIIYFLIPGLTFLFDIIWKGWKYLKQKRFV